MIPGIKRNLEWKRRMTRPEIIERLEALRKKSSTCSMTVVILIIAANISLFVFYWEPKIALLVCGLLLICAIRASTFSGKCHNKYRQIYKEAIVKAILEEKFEDVQYDWKKGFTGPDLYDFQLLKYRAHISDDYLKASYKGVNFEQADVKHFDRYSTINFRGRMMRFRNPSSRVSGVWIYTKRFDYLDSYAFKSAKYMLQMDKEFGEKFCVFTKNEADVERVLTPQFKQALWSLEKKGGFGICMKGSKIHIAICSRRDTFDVDLTKKKIDYENEMDNLKKDVDNMIEIITMFGGIQDDL